VSFIIDAAINGQGPYAGKAYFFKRDKYVRYDWTSNAVDAGFPMPLSAWNLPGEFSPGIDAALSGTGKYHSKAFFFNDGQYVRYDWSTGQVDQGYPLNLTYWKFPGGFLPGIDAAVNGYGQFAGKAYFFKGNRYVRYDWSSESVDFEGELSAWKHPSPCSLVIDAALEGQGAYLNKAYFFREGVYVRYDWSSQACDAGYSALSRAWNIPKTFLYPSGRARDHIWYVTIDDTDYFQFGYDSHGPNLSRLQSIAETLGIQVDPIWMAHLTDEILADQTLLALFGAGSFPEWFTPNPSIPCWPDGNVNSAWVQQLDYYCNQIRNTDVPIFAVCGSHQLVAAAFVGWDAVGHMVPSGQGVPTVADEFRQNRSLMPLPRLGEVGIFPFRISSGKHSNPLLAGVADTSRFVEAHHDQVVSGRYHPSFEALLEPDPDRSPDPGRPANSCHANPVSAGDRCQVQALGLTGSGRVLYSTQFHPELPSGNMDIDAQSERLLLNFIDIAKGFWAARG
jgi:Hemopexin